MGTGGHVLVRTPGQLVPRFPSDALEDHGQVCSDECFLEAVPGLNMRMKLDLSFIRMIGGLVILLGSSDQIFLSRLAFLWSFQ